MSAPDLLAQEFETRPPARPALVDGVAGAVVSVGGRPIAVFGFTVRDGRIAGIELLADSETLAVLYLAPLRG